MGFVMDVWATATFRTGAVIPADPSADDRPGVVLPGPVSPIHWSPNTQPHRRSSSTLGRGEGDAGHGLEAISSPVTLRPDWRSGRRW